MQQQEHGSDHGLTRRDVMRRGAAVGGLVWTAPLLQSFSSPAFAEEYPPPRECPGWMTGGGELAFGNGPRGVTYGLGQINCDGSGPIEIEVNWGGRNGRANRFHTVTLLSVTCSNQPGVDPEQPFSCFDTITGTASGRLNGQAGYTLEFTFVDAGEPGIGNDRASIRITRDAAPTTPVLEVSGVIVGGNLQAHSSNDAVCEPC